MFLAEVGSSRLLLSAPRLPFRAARLKVTSLRQIEGIRDNAFYYLQHIPVFANIEEHLKFQVELEREGVMFAAGPMWTDDEQSWEGEGLVVVRAETREAAIAIAERDPMHTSGARSFHVRPWLINEGSVTVRLDYSTQKLTII